MERYTELGVAIVAGVLASLGAVVVGVLAVVLVSQAHGRELYPGQYAQVDPATKQWFKDQQVPGKGYSCCSAADGTKADEDIRDGNLWTRFTYTRYDYSVPGTTTTTEERSGWMEVPDQAIIRDGKPNPMGGPVVWYYTEGSRGEIVKIRCFKPASEG
jgi:hypothetical protein